MIKIIVVDSGVDHNAFPDIMCYSITECKKNGYIVWEDCQDQVGHGTAICDILTKHTNAVITVIRIYDNNYITSENKLMLALNYIKDKINCDIVLISSGIQISQNAVKMENICDDLTNRGVIIVSAFDNNGSLSYPAVFNSVIGIDVDKSITKLSSYKMVENSPVNIIGASNNFRVSWINGKYNIVNGTSFTAAYFASVISNLLIEKKHDFIKYLKANALEVITYKNKDMTISDKGFTSKTEKIVVFPFSKEIQAIANFEDLLICDKIDYYDIRQSGKVGSRINSLYPHINNQKVINNITEIDWNSNFDTFVCGHMDAIINVCGTKIQRQIIDNCLKYNKKLYSFDPISINHPLIFTPIVTTKNINRIMSP